MKQNGILNVVALSALVLGVAAFLAQPPREAHAQSQGAAHAHLVGKTVYVHQQDGSQSPWFDFNAVVGFNGKVTSVDSLGVRLAVKKRTEAGFYVYKKPLRRGNSWYKDKDYPFDVFLPWSAIKFVKVIS